MKLFTVKREKSVANVIANATVSVITANATVSETESVTVAAIVTATAIVKAAGAPAAEVVVVIGLEAMGEAGDPEIRGKREGHHQQIGVMIGHPPQRTGDVAAVVRLCEEETATEMGEVMGDTATLPPKTTTTTTTTTNRTASRRITTTVRTGTGTAGVGRARRGIAPMRPRARRPSQT